MRAVDRAVNQNQTIYSTVTIFCHANYMIHVIEIAAERRTNSEERLDPFSFNVAFRELCVRACAFKRQCHQHVQNGANINSPRIINITTNLLASKLCAPTV